MQIVDGSNTRQGAALRSMEEKARVPKTQEWRDQQAAIRESLERASTTLRNAQTLQTKAEPEATAAVAHKDHVGTAAPGCPGRQATAPAATSVPPHNFKPSQPKPSISPTAPNSVALAASPRNPQPRPRRSVRMQPTAPAVARQVKKNERSHHICSQLLAKPRRGTFVTFFGGYAVLGL
jgi:hypothetical protein